MKFHIRNLALLGVLAFPVCGAPKKAASKPRSGGVLVFQREATLESVGLSGTSISVLRDSFLKSGAAVEDVPTWNFSHDGRQLIFTTNPIDVDFFGAGAWRRYIFAVRYNTRQNVLLAAYGSKAVYPSDVPDFRFAQFTGEQKLVVGEGQVGQFIDSPSPHWVSIYDVKTRKRVFDSRGFVKRLHLGRVRAMLLKSLLEFPALSPEGNDLVCLATPDNGNSESERYTPQTPVAPTQLIHLDLKRKKAEVLTALQDNFSVARTTSNGNEETEALPIRVLRPQFAWHPTQKKFVFVGPTSPKSPTVNLFAFDLQTKKMTRLTNGAQDDFSPQWSLDGKQIYWIRGSVDTRKAGANRIWRADADGSGATAILPQIRGVTKIQLLPHIVDWGRYRKLSIEPLAGKDK